MLKEGPNPEKRANFEKEHAMSIRECAIQLLGEIAQSPRDCAIGGAVGWTKMAFLKVSVATLNYRHLCQVRLLQTGSQRQKRSAADS